MDNLDRVRGIIAVISVSGLVTCGILQALGLATTPQWLIGTAISWIGWFFGNATYQMKKRIELLKLICEQDKS